MVVACVGSFEWLLWLLTFRSKWQVRGCRLISCHRVCLLFCPCCWRFDCGNPYSWLWVVRVLSPVGTCWSVLGTLASCVLRGAFEPFADVVGEKILHVVR